MIIATIRILADSGNISEIIEVLSSVKGQTEGKSGCISSLIHQEVNNENRITYEERWETQEQLYNHIRSDLYRKILAVIDMSRIRKIGDFMVLCWGLCFMKIKRGS